MTFCLGKNCSIGLLCVSFINISQFLWRNDAFVNVYQFCMCPSFPFGVESGTRYVIVLIPDHCLSLFTLHLHDYEIA